jgi:hypothetical protein
MNDMNESRIEGADHPHDITRTHKRSQIFHVIHVSFMSFKIALAGQLTVCQFLGRQPPATQIPPPKPLNGGDRGRLATLSPGLFVRLVCLRE